MAGLTTEKVIETIEKYEPAPEARKNRQMLIDGESIVSLRGVTGQSEAIVKCGRESSEERHW